MINSIFVPPAEKHRESLDGLDQVRMGIQLTMDVFKVALRSFRNFVR